MKKSSILLLIAILLFSNIAFASNTYADIEDNWAQDAIVRLAKLGMFEGVYDETFQPDEHIKLNEVITLATKGFNLSPEKQQALYGWIDNFIQATDQDQSADEFVTRIELVAIAANLLDLSGKSLSVVDWASSFEDIQADHPLFAVIELINKLDVLPLDETGNFEPDRPTTRAEVAALFDALINLESTGGQVVEVRKPSNWIIIDAGDEQYRYLPVETDTIILRNGETRQIDEIQAGDGLTALYDLYGSVAVINVTPTTNDNNLLQSLAGLFKGFQETPTLDTLTSYDAIQVLQQILTPEQIAAAISGNWTDVGEGFRHNLTEELAEIGLTPWETEALLSRDWKSVQNMGVDRAALLVSDYLNLTPEIFYAVVNQNWDQLLEYAQIEIAQRLLTSLSM